MTIEESLKRGFSNDFSKQKGDELDFKIVCSSKQVLMKQINFKPAKTKVNYQMQQLRDKYVLLNPQQKDTNYQPVLYNKDGTKKRERLPSLGESDDSESTIDIPKPAHVIYPASKIKLNWQVNRSIGCTLANQGNTCFMNSVLQCLTYTPPLYNYYQTGHHKQTCKRPGLCVMCTIENHVHMVMKQPAHVITPVVLTSKFRNIQKQMETGRQHDVHEFLRVLLEEMHKSCLYGFSKDLDRLTEETSAVYQVFGGKIRNRICCTNCKYRSDTFETFLDLPLDLKSKSMEQCLRVMMKPEMLFGDNKYKCSGCRKLVDARKTFRIVKPPNVLTVVLKRYDASGRNIKNRRFIEYPEYFDLRPFMAGAKKPVKYKLYGVLPHEGSGSGQGHYFTYVRAPNNNWYKMNDHASDRAVRNYVMNAEAYLLFYVRMIDNEFTSPENGRIHTQSPKTNHSYANGSTSFSPLPQKHAVKSTHPCYTPTVTKPSTPRSVATSLPQDRAKLSFTINRKDPGNTISQKPIGSTKNSNMKSLTRKTAESFLKPKVRTETPPHQASPSKSGTSSNITSSKPILVPYGSDSSDSEDYDEIVQKLSVKSSEKNKSKIESSNVRGSNTNSTKKEDSKTSPLSNNKNLMAMRSTESPLRLAITTDCNASKMMSTGLWKVSAETDQKPPSIASDASNTSASSTSEWNVQEKKKLTPLPKESSCEAEFLGWTVSHKPPTEIPVSPSIPQSPTSLTEGSSSSINEKRSWLKEKRPVTNTGSKWPPIPLPPPQHGKQDIKPSQKWKSAKQESNKHSEKYNGHQNGHSIQLADKSNGHICENSLKNKLTSNANFNLKRDFSKNEQIKNDVDSMSSKRSRMANNSSSDASWKQTNTNNSGNLTSNNGDNKYTNQTPTKTFSSTAPTQAWDQHVRDGYHRKDLNQSSSSRSAWDGRDNDSSNRNIHKTLSSTSMRSYGSSGNHSSTTIGVAS
ncbi:ubiquitin carboxyl-terminal hydrolase 42-like [Anneissia japonica]|uniref:ubiquitin carboxyl-terminal hydrolase 42-like n=1 Tax=Anneissia japonica TaxID=1529436 RepID=UPI00142593F5|nr:ubiquitin carboxyl-terminal hydrolase 42-like [Anneissia japonica]